MNQKRRAINYAMAGLLALGASGAATVANAAGMEKCYGVNAVHKNDCSAGAHACAGMASKANDPQSFVLVPSGVCSKLSGGSTKPGM
ncbi:BufA1 family periplasmic bufferin-type metallophore [Acidihalobacter prosperus]